VQPVFPRMLSQCIRPSLPRASAVLDRMANPEQFKLRRRSMRLWSGLIDERHRFDIAVLHGGWGIGAPPSADA
jgi:hypothetical protein